MIGARTTPIGLDIGARRVKAAQWTVSRAGARLTAAACIDRASPGAAPTAEEAALIRAVLDRQGFTGSCVVTGAPSSRLVTGVMELPPRSSGAPLDHIARAELARTNGLPAGAMEMAWWELPPGSRAVEGTHVFAVALRHADADAMLDALEGGGFEVRALDAGLLALGRLALREPSAEAATGQRQVRGLVDLGATGATIAVLHGPTLVYQRTLGELGLSALHERLVGSLRVEPDVAALVVSKIGLDAELTEEQRGWQLLDEARAAIADYADAVGSEIRASLTYAARRYASGGTDGVLLAGGGAESPGVAARIERAAEAPVRTLAAGASHGPALACAAGLALWTDAAERQERLAA